MFAMRINHLIASIEDEAAGPSFIVPALASELGALGHDVSLLSLGETGDEQQQGYSNQKFVSDYQNVSILRNLKFSKSMHRAAATQTTDIIHSHGLWLMPNLYGAWSQKNIGCKLVVSPHGMLAPQALKFSGLRKWIFAKTLQNRALAAVDLFHATSEAEVKDIRNARWRQPIALVPLGVAVPPTLNSHPKTGLRTLLYLGRLHPIKRLDDLISAWRDLAPLHPDWRLRIIGPGESSEVERLQLLIRTYHLPRITLESALFGAEKTKAMADADLFVLPSQSENFAMTVAEALAQGLPVVCSKGAPWAGLLTEACGWWPDVGQLPLTAALRDALAQPPQALRAMGERARLWMVRDFSLNAMGRKMESVYRWLLTGEEEPDFIYHYEEKI
jgi:glycosyltransferase involved in cell wall biosynthesis